MAMPAVRTEWTVEMLDELPDDGNRYELIDGELFVTPAPSDVHQLVVVALAARLRGYLRPTSVGRVLISPSDVRRGNPRNNRVQPDVFAVKLVDGRRPAYPFDLGDVLLAAEVLSPGNPRYDYQTKRQLYLGAGIPEYWIVDPEAQTVARWRSAADPGELLTERIQWQPGGLEVPLVIELPEFFEDALG
jgi:Uma2 family endonuclease